MSNIKADKYIIEKNGTFEVRVTSAIKGLFFERRRRGIKDRPCYPQNKPESKTERKYRLC